jgi:hypothetical protein
MYDRPVGVFSMKTGEHWDIVSCDAWGIGVFWRTWLKLSWLVSGFTAVVITLCVELSPGLGRHAEVKLSDLVLSCQIFTCLLVSFGGEVVSPKLRCLNSAMYLPLWFSLNVLGQV